MDTLTPKDCELCHRRFNGPEEKHYYYIDGDRDNIKIENLIVLCSPCMGHWRKANPEGIQKKYGLFAFAINRRLYDFQIANQKMEKKRDERRSRENSNADHISPRTCTDQNDPKPIHHREYLH